MSTKTMKAKDARQTTANQIVGDAGINYFNPLIGNSAGETCTKTEPIMEMLYGLLDRNLISEDMNPGVKLIIQIVWVAMQYECDTAEQSEGEAA